VLEDFVGRGLLEIKTYVLFATFLIIYTITWLGNVTIITTVIIDQELHKPIESSVTLPKMLWDFLSEYKSISFGGCIAQIFFFHFTGGAVVVILTVMTLDRYVAVHKPLQYLNIMNHNVCLGLVAGAWIGGFVHSIVQVALIIQLPFCGPNLLDNFYCDFPQVIKLACTDIYAVELLMVSNSGLLMILIFIVLNCVTCCHLGQNQGTYHTRKHKAFSTCGAQVAVVSIHFVPCIFIYAWPFKKFVADKAMSSLYTIITPMLNPIIYTLRNTEMKNAIKKFSQQCLSQNEKFTTVIPFLDGCFLLQRNVKAKLDNVYN
uniref:G-protein coupled receptors family 1 profile domain-containing protein n=1 Tax=Anas platyrhynchos TaxID=8839 RepID=A0A8B9QWU7_ANAPL